MLEAAHWVFILPIKTFLAIVFSRLVDVVGNYGIAVIALSVLVNTLLLPVWNWSEALQRRERERQLKMSHHLRAVKQAFRGELRFAMTRTVHRIHRYHPAYALQSSVGLLLQIPFFIAAYQLLGHYDAMVGVSFGPLSDLTQPDALLSLGSVSVNLLPLLMTALNLASSFFYTSSLDRGNRLQLYLIALLFLLLLYNSPAALLLYWSCNNAFSLVKMLLRQLPAGSPCTQRPRWQKLSRQLQGPFAWQLALGSAGLLLGAQYVRIYRVDPLAETAVMIGLIVLASYYALLALPAMVGWPSRSRWKQTIRVAFTVLLLLALIPLIARFFALETDYQAKLLRRSIFTLLAVIALLGLGPRLPHSRLWPRERERPLSPWMLLLPWSTLALLAMLQAPAALLASSPDELDTAFGWLVGLQLPRTLFLVVAGALLSLIATKRRFIAILLTAALFVALFNTFVPLGNYDKMVNFTIIDAEQLSVGLPLMLFDIAMLLTFPLLVAWLLYRRLAWLKAVETIALLVVIASTGVSFATLTHEQRRLKALGTESTNTQQEIVLSRDKPNVLVLMLDRFVGPYMADILQQYPDVAEKLDGFRWYRNTVSVSSKTISSLPALFGGYRYTVDRLNQQSEKSLGEKINQAYLVLPENFAATGFRNVIVDPQLAGGQTTGDCRLFADTPDTDCYRLKGRFTASWAKSEDFFANNNLLAVYGTFRIAPASLRLMVYALWDRVANQNQNSLAYRTFVDSWSVIDWLPRISQSDAGPGTFLLLNNLATHDPSISYDGQPAMEPEMLPEDIKKFHDRKSTEIYYIHRAVVQRLVRWFDWMKKEGVYDNTRIILVSDHGHDVFSPYLAQQHGWVDDEQTRARLRLMPLLLIKDFQQRGPLVWDDTLMSNADTTRLATDQLIEHPVERDGRPLLLDGTSLPFNIFVVPWFLNLRKRTVYPINEQWQLVAPDTWRRDSWRRIK